MTRIANRRRARSLLAALLAGALTACVDPASRLDDFFDELLQSPHAEDMIIVVHGDHGSRLDCGPPKQRFVRNLDPQDYVDGFSTLFAVRRSGIPAGYDRRMVAVDQLFASSMRDGFIPEGDDWIEEPEVMFEQRAIFKSYPMPSFERDLEALQHLGDTNDGSD